MFFNYVIIDRCCCGKALLIRLISDRYGLRPDGSQLKLLTIARAGVFKQSVMAYMKALYSCLALLITTIWYAVCLIKPKIEQVKIQNDARL